MHIQVLCPHFEPDVAPTGGVMTRIAEELAARGNRLSIVTSLPWYRDHAIEPAWSGKAWRSEELHWGSIIRVHPFPTDKRNIPARALAFAGFTGLVTVAGVLQKSRPDVVLAMSPPLTLGMAGWIVARARRVPFVFNIQDVFPDVAIDLGMLNDPRVISMARSAERFTYRRADAVTVLSDDLADNVRTKIATDDPAKVHVIPNFVDTESIRPLERENGYRREYGLVDKRVVMYAGNVGHSQSLDLLLHAATEIDDDDVVFVVNGGGVAREELQQRAQGMSNVVFVGMQPEDRLAELLAAGDIHVVPLKAGLAQSSVPSKTYSILAAGRPIVASVDVGTEIARTIEEAGAGLAVEPESPDAFTAALRTLLDDPDRASDMGASGRRFVEQWASPAAVAEQYEKLFADLIATR